MTTAKLNIFLRVIKRRIKSGETLEQILKSYSKLSNEEKMQIKEAFYN